MVGQWMGKARKMAADFQGQFQEAMREAEMADLKKSFDEVREAASGFTGGNVMTSLQKDVSESLRIDDVEKPAASTDAPAISTDTPAVAEATTPAIDLPAIPTTAEAPTPATSAEADAHAAVAEPVAKDAKAS
jgi:sec-independent protein translocase protein TatB